MDELSHRVPDRMAALAMLRVFVRDLAGYAGRGGIATVGFVAVGAVLEGFGLLLLVPLLGIVTASGAPFGRGERIAHAAFARFGIETAEGRLLVLLVAFGALMVLRAWAVSNRDIRLAELQIGFVEHLRLRVAELLARAPWDRVVRLRHARVTHLMSGDIQRVGMACSVMLRTAIALVMLLAQAAVLVFMAPRFAALGLVVLAVGSAMYVPVMRHAHRSGSITTGAHLKLLDTTAQFLGGLKLAISQNLQSGFIGEFRTSLDELRRTQIDLQRRQTMARLAFSSLSALAGVVLVLVGYAALHAAPGTLIAMLAVIARMGGPVAQLQGVQQMIAALPAYKTVRELEGELAGLAAPIRAAEAHPLPEGPVVLDGVTFLHDEGHGEGGVQDLTLRLDPGEFVGVSGPSGAGKTTFADLLVGLVPPQRGEITVAGVALAGEALAGWRESIAYVSQDAFLFHDSVRRNLAWVRTDVTDAEIWRALDFAGAADLVRRLEHGLDTVLGERGTLISGGERQRIALARAILRRPRLLVLDEATSAIDIAGERAILARLGAMQPRPLIVLIAHRAESLVFCDRVLRFEAGNCRPETASARTAG